MGTPCPTCGFSNAWDGVTCGHCRNSHPDANVDTISAGQKATDANPKDKPFKYAWVFWGLLAIPLWALTALMIWQSVRELFGPIVAKIVASAGAAVAAGGVGGLILWFLDAFGKAKDAYDIFSDKKSKR